MDEAVANELVDANPCGYVKAPRPKPKERKALSDEQALELAIALRTEEQTGSTVAVWIALATGMRRGEILGLVWRNVDFERKRIYVGQQYAADHKIRDPKSEKSHRWLGLDDGTVTFLAEWKEKQARAMEIAGSTRTRRRPFAPTLFTSTWIPTRSTAGAASTSPTTAWASSGPRCATRTRRGGNAGARGRTSATTCTSSGTRRQRCSSAPAPISRQCSGGGHSSASLTMDIYAHFIAQNDRAAANTIGNILAEASDKSKETERPSLSEADKAAIAQRMADGASLEAAISTVRPDVSVLDLLGL